MQCAFIPSRELIKTTQATSRLSQNISNPESAQQSVHRKHLNFAVAKKEKYTHTQRTNTKTIHSPAIGAEDGTDNEISHDSRSRTMILFTRTSSLSFYTYACMCVRVHECTRSRACYRLIKSSLPRAHARRTIKCDWDRAVPDPTSKTSQCSCTVHLRVLRVATAHRTFLFDVSTYVRTTCVRMRIRTLSTRSDHDRIPHSPHLHSLHCFASPSSRNTTDIVPGIHIR